MPSTTITREFELKDGRTLSCTYEYRITYGVHTLSNGDPGYPDEAEPGEPEYELDGVPVEVDKLPKGLEAIANAMYEASQDDKRFTFKEDSDFNEPDDFYYD